MDGFTPEQQAAIDAYEQALSERMASREKRLAHSLSVGREAEKLARIYGVDPYAARVAGILHDWEKAVPDVELIPVAEELDIDLGDDPFQVKQLLHGLIAQKTLAERFPELSGDVLQAVSRHTTGAVDMTDLDKVLFVADGIEPLRKSVPAIERQRALVGEASLDELWRISFIDGMKYVLETGRHLWPGTVTIYNGIIG
jgi:predicted HD superfamily hydrolase involved in NAD metabolism